MVKTNQVVIFSDIFMSNHWKLIDGVQRRTTRKGTECSFYRGTGRNHQSLSRNDVVRCRTCSPGIKSTLCNVTVSLDTLTPHIRVLWVLPELSL
jgi:hypothetical protein